MIFSLRTLLVLAAHVSLGMSAVMLVWSCKQCPYSTSVTEGKVYLEDNLEVSGSLTVRHILGEKGDSSLEIRGPLDGLKTARAEVQIHEGSSCSRPGDIVYTEKCRNCQQYISLKILNSKQALSLGDGLASDVANKLLVIHDVRQDKMVGCGQIRVNQKQQ